MRGTAVLRGGVQGVSDRAFVTKLALSGLTHEQVLNEGGVYKHDAPASGLADILPSVCKMATGVVSISCSSILFSNKSRKIGSGDGESCQGLRAEQCMCWIIPKATPEN